MTTDSNEHRATPPTVDDQLVWSVTSGTVLLCTQDLRMGDSGEVAFTVGRSYKVDSMHPIAEPPFVRVRNDQGQTHGLLAADLRRYFGR